jgi:hypothetical protein
MYYCLNKHELKQFIEYKVDGSSISDDSLKIRIENAEYWQDEIGGLTYLFSQIVDRKVRGGEDCAAYIEILYRLQDEMAFQVHECDRQFIDFMLRNLRDSTLTLEEELVDIQSHLSRYEYRRAIRFRHERANSIF